MKYSKEILQNLVNTSNNYSEVTRKLGLKTYYGNRQTVKKYIELFKIDTRHFRLTTLGCGGKKKKLETVDILVEDSKYRHTTDLKERLYKEGLKDRICEMCGQNETWNGKKISLILDHVNGKNNDNRIENLRIVCPNCNATLPTYGGKNVKHTKNIKIETHVKNKPKNDYSHNSKLRKVERPDYPTLINEIENLGYRGTGVKYGVSDNSIRKWKKYYEKHFVIQKNSLPL
jgi:hypothetical protein